MSTAISISDLVKAYGTVSALDGLNLEVARGDMHGGRVRVVTARGFWSGRPNALPRGWEVPR